MAMRAPLDRISRTSLAMYGTVCLLCLGTVTPASLAVAAAADLALTAVSGPTTAAVGVTASLSATVRNFGTGGTGSGFGVGFYLSTDTALGSTDVFVTSCSTTALDAGVQRSVFCSGTVPTATAGQYYWVACADYQNGIPESIENNNCGFSPVTITPIVTIVSGPSGSPNPVISGGAVNVAVSATDSHGLPLRYTWAALCPMLGGNGSFSDASAQSPTWTAPANMTGNQETCTLTVTVSDAQGAHATGQYSQRVSRASGPCDSLTLTPIRVMFSPGGGISTVNVFASDSCGWTVFNTNPDLITITSAQGGTGNGTIVFTAAPNFFERALTGKLLVSGKEVLVLDDIDTDADGLGDSLDNCPTTANPGQQDGDENGTGDACENLVVRANIDDSGNAMRRIDGSDLFILAHAFGSSEGDLLFDYRADLNRDSQVEGTDLALMASVFSEAVP